MITMIIDGQFGSTGKGKLADALLTLQKFDACVCDFGPNAGHTVVDEDGVKYVFRQVPVGVRYNIPCYIGAGSVIDLSILKMEISAYRCEHLIRIHPRTAVICPKDKKDEEKALFYMASTLSGTGAAVARKIMRRDATLAQDVPELKKYVDAWREHPLNVMMSAKSEILVESAQGFLLSLDWGFYPHVTHRNVTVPAILDRVGLHPRYLRHTWMTMRTFPIRVGNFTDEHDVSWSSGPVFEDQDEISWDQIGVSEERTTCTNRVRRVFTWSPKAFELALQNIIPDSLFFNFMNYLPDPTDAWAVWVESQLSKVNSSPREYHNIWLGTGPKTSDLVML